MTTITSSPASAPDVAPSTAAAPRRGRWRRAIGWIVVVALVLGGSLIAGQITARPPEFSGTLDPESAGPRGAQALAEILRDQGVEISVVRSRAGVADELDDDATLVTTEPAALTDDGVRDLLAPATRTVLLTSSARTLRLLDLGETTVDLPDDVAPQCAEPEFARVGTILPDRMFTPVDGVTGCFGGPTGDAAVLVDDRDPQHHVSLVEGGRLFSNEYLAADGNAALALALLGQTERVVWYVPSFSDTDITAEAPETLGTHTPPWLTPAIILLLLAGLAAAIWRGRRFGPLVAETLPVTVRASETMHGRARLTAKAADAPHAAEALRTGTVRRLARRLALGERVAAHEVADAASDRLRIPRGSLHDLLDGPPPGDDPQLVELARRLAELEDAVDTALHADRTAQTPASPDDHTRSGRNSP